MPCQTRTHLSSIVLSIIIITAIFMASASLVMATACEDQGYVQCTEERCNIGHTNCNDESPSKTQTVPEGQDCTFTGTITNRGCAWTNPATLSISGNDCSISIKYYDCETKSYSVTCSEGDVFFSADDSSYFTLSKECEPLTPQTECGNGVIEEGEECEMPGTNNNAYCSQMTWTCSGNKMGVRDSVGFCTSECTCAEDQYTYHCVKGECGAECGSDQDCNDQNPSTIDKCTAQCACTHTANPNCGNGIIDEGEECEEDSDCLSYEACVNCVCVEEGDEGLCGNGELDSGEACDNGHYNGVACFAGRNQTCTYCNDECEVISVGPGMCGDGIVDVYEQCDAGASNGQPCNPDCGRTCYYCTENCMVAWEVGEACGSGGSYVVTVLPSVYYSGSLYQPLSSTGVCGNNIVESGEECDEGVYNGELCSAPCDGSCTYCSINCEEIVLTGSPCARTPRPWETGIVGYQCEEIVLLPVSARLDYACEGDNRLVTGWVNESDNFYATQKACGDDYVYVTLGFGDARRAGVLKAGQVWFEHKEVLTRTYVQIEGVDGWEELCELPVRRIDSYDNCSLKSGFLDFSYLRNASMRLRIKRTGVEHASLEMLDHAYLNLVYCYYPGAVCGNNVLEGSEECDDGNVVSGDGCSQFCKLEYVQCGDWSACEDGKQGRTCFYSGELRTQERLCQSKDYSSLLFIILVILIILFLFLFPYLFLLFLRKQEEEKKKRKKSG